MVQVSAPLPMPPKPPSRGWALALTILVGLWTVGVVVVVNALLWLIGDTLVISGLSMPLPFWLLGAALTTLLTGVPALLLGLLSRMWFARLAGRQWLLTTLFGGLLGTARLIPDTYHELYLAVLAVVAAIAAAIHTAVTGRRERADGWLFWLSLAVGLLVLLPWLWVGSFGGVLETVLALLAALAVGWLAIRPLSALSAIAVHFRNDWAGATLGGLVIGVGLTSLVAGVGLPAVQLLALLAVPPVAFVLAALHRKGRPSTVALLTPAVFGPLGMIDPEETSLILGLRDALFWGLVGAAATFGVALVVAVAVLVVFRRARWHAGVAGVAAVVVAIGGAVVYTALGQPGFAGERLFVVMKEQADLSGLSGVGDRTARIRQTYQRLVDTAERSQAPLRKALRDKDVAFTPFYLVNGIEVDAGPVARQWLESRPDVAKVLLNPHLRPLPATAPPMRGTVDAPTSPQWNLKLIGADTVWERFGTGEGIVVGSSDSGVDGTHPALRGNFRGGDDSWLNPYGGGTVPTDNNGHGTHTLATAVGAGVGVAPGAKWIACENLPRNLGSMANYLTCLQFMLAPYPAGADPWHAGRPERAPQVLTNSWGCPEIEGCDLSSLRPAVDAFAAAGIFFVAAAGNTGPRCETVTDAPATYPSTLTIGAVNRGSEVASFSSRGPTPDGRTKPDLMAPGVDVLSALPGGRYGYLSGTSMATPHVAGVVALMWSANPALVGDIDRTRAILERTARPVQPSGEGCGAPADIVGAGLVDALAAVTAAAPAPSG